MVIEQSQEERAAYYLQQGKKYWDPFLKDFNLVEGFNMFKLAAEENNPEAMFILANAYLHGRGTDVREDAANEWFQKAAEAGVGDAQMIVAEKCEKDGDEEAALHWYEEAEKNNVCMADERKSLILIKKHNRNISNTFEWYKEGADLGIVMDCYRIGMIYYKGDGVQPDYELAEKYLIKADNEAGINQELLSETLGDIYAFHLNEPLKALPHYYSMEDGKKVLDKKLKEIRSRMGFFERRKFDKGYNEWLQTIKLAEEIQKQRERD